MTKNDRTKIWIWLISRCDTLTLSDYRIDLKQSIHAKLSPLSHEYPLPGRWMHLMIANFVFFHRGEWPVKSLYREKCQRARPSNDYTICKHWPPLAVYAIQIQLLDERFCTSSTFWSQLLNCFTNIRLDEILKIYFGANENRPFCLSTFMPLMTATNNAFCLIRSESRRSSFTPIAIIFFSRSIRSTSWKKYANNNLSTQ